MNRESSCVAYFESKFSPKQCGGLKAIGMTASEVRRAMRKYCTQPPIEQPTNSTPKEFAKPAFKDLSPDVKDEILDKIIKRQGTLRSIAEAYGVTLNSIHRIANEVMHLRKQTPVKIKPSFINLPQAVKDEIRDKIIKRQGTLRSIAEAYGVTLGSIERIAEDVMHLRKQTPRIRKKDKNENN